MTGKRIPATTTMMTRALRVRLGMTAVMTMACLFGPTPAASEPAVTIEDKLVAAVNEAANQARQIGQGTAGSATDGGGAAVPGGRTAPPGSGICLLGVCSGTATPAPAGSGAMKSYDVSANFLSDFATFGLCTEVARLRSDLARTREEAARARLTAELGQKQALITPTIQRDYCARMSD